MSSVCLLQLLHLNALFYYFTILNFQSNKVLEFERCDLDIKSNKRSHHTEQNGEDRLIVRRGQPFSLVLHLKAGSPEFNPEETSFTLIVETGTVHCVESDTKVSFGLKDSTDDKEWSASASKAPGNTVALNISSSPEAPIGLYSLSLLQQGQSTSLGAFVLLFNAWCPRDAVYMRSETKRQEYVLSQHGLLYRGSATRIHHKPWNFSQFEPGILDICLKILDEGLNVVSDTDQDCSERRSPVYITRVLSAMINSNDNEGVLVGEWAEFEDGVHPSTWIGSGDILRQWADSGPVCYGQCWVFAAVDCTVSRALGIPCRVVTNFSSAHDGNGNLLIEKMYDEDGERLEDPDSVWNFHVWVESWMARPDLEQAGFDGWQVSDATPQETSEGVFCCGPVPVSAIREGELTKKFDAPFVFAEVNADVVEYVKLSTGDFVKFSGSTDSIGQNISTKAVGRDKRRDITHHYKYPEGAVIKRNETSTEPALCCAYLCCIEKLLFLKLKYSDYGKVISPDRMIQLTAFVNDKENREYHKAEKLIVLDEPDLEVKLTGEARVGQPLTAELCLLNPLPEALQDCSFTLEGVGLTQEKPITIKYVSLVLQGGLNSTFYFFLKIVRTFGQSWWLLILFQGWGPWLQSRKPRLVSSCHPGRRASLCFWWTSTATS
uniref:Protein-glutamine gamma-glutamyltransferase 2 n=1 Tax=Gadus morhua TaxID=8049 RepID=A0A8C4ZIH7_GADMO